MFKNKKIGIWGYGLTGRSATSYFHALGNQLEVLDKKSLTPIDSAYFTDNNITFTLQSEEAITTFFERNEYIIVSPGIDITPYKDRYKEKIVHELDLFYTHWKKPIIAITGSIGKTTITHLLSSLLKFAGKRVTTGGNIGIPIFELLKEETDLAILEVSSFQLEHCNVFAPDLAIITNIHPNHLDRHGSLASYIQAKAQITRHQQATQHLLLPRALQEMITSKARTTLFSLESIQLDITHLPSITFPENWLIILMALQLLEIPLPPHNKLIELTLPEHRLEKVATINGIDFYNDSKATTIQSTLAAVEQLHHRPLYLLLGGLSKGVNRLPLLEQIKGKVTRVYCFGKEAQELKSFCDAAGIPGHAFATLDEAVKKSRLDMHPGDQLLLSPAGSSYDLFENFMERGNYFKKLIIS